MSRVSIGHVILLVLLFFPGLNVFAAQSASSLALPCLGCHSHEGKTGSSIPVIKQLEAEEMYVRLKAFKEGSMSSTVMGRIAKGYSDEQLRAIAEYFGEGE